MYNITGGDTRIYELTVGTMPQGQRFQSTETINVYMTL